jgi:hypothetical protein
MPHAAIKLKPGVETNTTPSLNESAYSTSQLIRYLPERNGFGLAQKLGGWVNYANTTAPINSSVRALKGWSDLNGINRLGIGAEASLDILTPSVSSTPVNITPQSATTNTAPVFVTSTGANSNIVTVTDSNIEVSTYDYVNYITPVSVGGLVLYGPYQVYSASGYVYSIQVPNNATSAADTSANTTAGSFVVAETYQIVSVGTTDFTLIGAASNTVGVIFNATGVGTGTGTAKLVGVPSFQTTSGNSIVTVYLDNHGLSVGNSFYVGLSTVIGGLTLFGLYDVTKIINAGTFQIAATNTATSNAGPTAMNSGNVNSAFYIAIGPSSTSTGYGVGGYGTGGYGIGSTQPQVPGTPITATDWTLDNFGSYLVACPAGGAIYYYDPNGQLQNAQFIGGSAPVVSSGIFVAMPERQIIAYGSSFNLQADPLLVRWCDIGDFTVWNATVTNQAGSYRIPTGSKIVAGIQGPQQGLLWTDLDMWAMQYVGFPLVYGFNKIASNCGAVSRHCVGQLNGVIYWMSQKQFFMSTGSGSQPIPCPIWDVIFQNINTSYLYKVCCGVNSQFNEVTWYYPSASSTENDSYVKYNYVLGQWDYGTLGRTAWIDQSVLGPPIGAGSDNWIYQHEIGNDASYNGVTTGMQSSFSTGYVLLNEADNLVFVDQIWPDMKWGTYSGNQNATVYLTINYTNYATDPATSPSTSAYSGSPSNQVTTVTYPMTQSTEYISCRIRARFMSFSLSSTDTGTFWRLGGIRYRFQPDGRF